MPTAELLVPSSSRPALHSRVEFAEHIGRSVKTVDRWIRSKKISHLRDGRLIMIDPVQAVNDLKRNLTIYAVGGAR